MHEDYHRVTCDLCGKQEESERRRPKEWITAIESDESEIDICRDCAAVIRKAKRQRR